MPNSNSISYANIIWKDNVPCSLDFDDIYFSKSGGTDETKHVFINGNNLYSRFANIDDNFTIIETGFGTGLNFLVTADLWLKTSPDSARLHFISTEKHPLSPDDLAKALTFFPEFETLTSELIEQYPPLCQGFHNLVFCDGKIKLTLLYGDINQTLPQLEATADAWFLDGFAPAKNEGMWTENLFNHIARLSKQDTTLATYSAEDQRQ